MASGSPGAFLVDSIPLLKYVPGWMPGAGFKHKAKEWNSLTKQMMETPFTAAQSAIVSREICAMEAEYRYLTFDLGWRNRETFIRFVVFGWSG